MSEFRSYCVCRGCCAGIPPATLDEINTGHQTCPTCGEPQNYPNRTLADYIYEDLLPRIAQLEQEVERLQESPNA